MSVDYTIVSKPAYVQFECPHCHFECPHCHEDVEVSFNDVDYKTDYWDDGAWVDCPYCNKEVELDNYEYD